MTAKTMWRNGTIAAALVVIAACAPQAGSSSGGPAFQSTLPGGPLGGIPRATLRALGRKVTWVGCDTTARTAWPAGQTDVEICAASYSRDVGQGNTNAKGVLVARMVNMGANVENRWGLSPTDTSFIVAFPRNSAQGLYAILEIPRNTFPGTKIRVLLDNGNLIYCPNHSQPASSSAEFETCLSKQASASHQTGAGVNASGPSAPEEVPLQLADGPAWVSCRTGCCTTEMQ